MISLIAAAVLAGPKLRAYSKPVVIWIPPYAVSRSRSALESVGALDSITHLDLQFWQPTKTGGAELVPEPEVTREAIEGARDWAHSKGVRVMLCVFNGEKDWDWPLAKAAFAGHPQAFIKSLTDEVDKYKLDGVDIDLEGPGSFDSDRPAFVHFMKDLSSALHKAGKHVTVDSFSYVWNAPNENWWQDLLPLVDGLTSMGYDFLGRSATDWKSYDAQRKAAGPYASRLQIGLTGDKDKWAGSTTQEQLDWFVEDRSAGVAIWDAQLKGSSWHKSEIWKTIRSISVGK